MSIKIQLLTMAMMVACGIAMSLLYDTYRVLKGQTGIRGWLVIICDILFWASCTFLVFGTLLRINEGMVRIYLFFGMGLGAWLYFLWFHSLYLKLFLAFLHAVKVIYRFTVRLVHVLFIQPIVFMYKIIVAAIVAIAVFLWKAMLIFYRILSKWFVPLGHWTGRMGIKVYVSSKKKGTGFLRKIGNILKMRRKK